MTKTNQLSIVKAAARIADEKMGDDIVVIDVRQITSLTEYFIFISATSFVHVKTIEDAIRVGLKEEGKNLLRTDGKRGHLWRVLDYGSVLIHVMDKNIREFYSIERLWEEGKKLSLSQFLPSKKSPPKKKKKKATKRKTAAKSR